MNKQRRKRLEQVEGQIRELMAEIESIKEEEQEAFDNLPESMQYASKGEAMEAAIENLDSLYTALEEAENYAQEAAQ